MKKWNTVLVGLCCCGLIAICLSVGCGDDDDDGDGVICEEAVVQLHSQDCQDAAYGQCDDTFSCARQCAGNPFCEDDCWEEWWDAIEVCSPGANILLLGTMCGVCYIECAEDFFHVCLYQVYPGSSKTCQDCLDEIVDCVDACA
ncbi:hypothetical protein ACFL4G_00485 [Thermodesulfobacteriota bacterium]